MAGGVKGKQNKKYNVALDMVSLLAQPQHPNIPTSQLPTIFTNFLIFPLLPRTIRL